MSNSRIARVYATALYEAAREEDRVDAVWRDLGSFVLAVRDSGELRRFLSAEEVSDAKKKEALLELTEGGDQFVRNLLLLLVDKNRESELASIYEEFVDLVERARGIVHVEVVTAVPLSEALQESLRVKMESSLQKSVEMYVSVDEELIGGLRVRIGDRVADASVRHRLDRLRELLTGPMSSLEGSVEAAS